MTGDVLPFAKSPHRAALELLPWYLNGSLDGDEAAQVEQHLRACASCRAELDSLRLLQAAYVEGDSGEQADAALHRLLPRLDGEPAPRQRPRARTAAGTSRWFEFWRPHPAPAGGPSWVRLALAVQCGLIFALGWKVIAVDRSVREEHAFRTLSSDTGAARQAGSMVVVFDPATPQGEVLRILRNCGVRIVDGPTSTNAYVLAPEPGRSLAPDDAVARLRAEKAVVLAAPLVAPSAAGSTP